MSPSGVDRECFASEEELKFAVAPTTTSDTHSILRNIHDDDHEALGFKHGRPDYLMMTALLVPPVIMRPSVCSSESARTKGHDDLTQKLQDIVKVRRPAATMMHNI